MPKSQERLVFELGKAWLVIGMDGALMQFNKLYDKTYHTHQYKQTLKESVDDLNEFCEKLHKLEENEPFVEVPNKDFISTFKPIQDGLIMIKEFPKECLDNFKYLMHLYKMLQSDMNCGIRPNDSAQ